MDTVYGFCSHFWELLPGVWLTPAPQSAPGRCSQQDMGLGNQAGSERAKWDCLFLFFLIKMILVSGLPPTVLAAQKPNVNSWLTIIFLSVIIILKF